MGMAKVFFSSAWRAVLSIQFLACILAIFAPTLWRQGDDASGYMLEGSWLQVRATVTEWAGVAIVPGLTIADGVVILSTYFFIAVLGPMLPDWMIQTVRAVVQRRLLRAPQDEALPRALAAQWFGPPQHAYPPGMQMHGLPVDVHGMPLYAQPYVPTVPSPTYGYHPAEPARDARQTGWW